MLNIDPWNKEELFASCSFCAEGEERAAANLDVTGAGDKKKRVIKGRAQNNDGFSHKFATFSYQYL